MVENLNQWAGDDLLHNPGAQVRAQLDLAYLAAEVLHRPQPSASSTMPSTLGTLIPAMVVLAQVAGLTV